MTSCLFCVIFYISVLLLQYDALLLLIGTWKVVLKWLFSFFKNIYVFSFGPLLNINGIMIANGPLPHINL